MKVRNNGKRKIIYQGGELLPGSTSKDLPEKIAKLVKSIFPGEVDLIPEPKAIVNESPVVVDHSPVTPMHQPRHINKKKAKKTSRRG